MTSPTIPPLTADQAELYAKRMMWVALTELIQSVRRLLEEEAARRECRSHN